MGLTARKAHVFSIGALAVAALHGTASAALLAARGMNFRFPSRPHDKCHDAGPRSASSTEATAEQWPNEPLPNVPRSLSLVGLAHAWHAQVPFMLEKGQACVQTLHFRGALKP